MIKTYVCSTVENGQCLHWIEQTSLINEFAITAAQAGQISAAICASLLIGWIFGEVGGFMKTMIKR